MGAPFNLPLKSHAKCKVLRLFSGFLQSRKSVVKKQAKVLFTWEAENALIGHRSNA